MKKLCDKINSVIIVPGVPGNSPNHWQKWLAVKCEKDLGLKTFYPKLENGEDRKLSNWLKVLNETLALIAETKNTAFVGHSLGCITILQLLKREEIKSAGLLILVSPSSLSRAEYNIPEIYSFYRGLRKKDMAAIVKKVLIRPHIYRGSNDLLINNKDFYSLSGSLGAWCLTIPNAGHINPASGYSEFKPALELITTCSK